MSRRVPDRLTSLIDPETLTDFLQINKCVVAGAAA